MPTTTTRTLNPLPFEALEPKRFEDLVRQLAYDFRPWRSLEATGRAGSDDGFDARGFEIADAPDFEPIDRDDETDDLPPQPVSDRVWLIQCKRERNITPAKIKKHLDEISNTFTNGLYGVIFAAACDFSKKTRDAFREWCRDKDISEAYMWGKADIEDQLYQPKNDGLLFAYFGISLRIRRRAVRTELRAKLAMKRKCERILGSHKYQDILLRDPEDDGYPYKLNVAESKSNPASWKIRRFLDIHPLGIMIVSRQFYAYIADDGKGWDFVGNVPINGDERRNNPWREARDDEAEVEKYESRVWHFWNRLPDARKAWLKKVMLIRFEDIIDIDGTGDSVANFPHVFVPKDAPVSPTSFVESMERYAPRRVEPREDTRVRFFPAEFPEAPMREVPD